MCDGGHVIKKVGRGLEAKERIFLKMYLFRRVWYVENGA